MKRFRPCLTVLTALLVLLLSTMSVLAADSGLADLPKLSKTEIIDLLQNPQLTDPDNYYEEAPSITAPHTAGAMRQELLDSGLQRLNVVRRLAGLGPVTMNEDFNLLSQKGSVVLAAGKQFTHRPVKPSDMDQAFFDAGYSATTHSNLAYYGYGSTASGVSYLPDPLSWSIDGYMSDSDMYNVEVVGHRRWMIDPRLTQVGMGAAHNYYRDGMWYCTDVYSATYWDVNWMIDADYDFIAWPASGLFPTTNFIIDQNARTPQSDAWSVSLNPDRYQTPSAEDITVTLSGGGKSWTFTDDQTYAVANTGLFFTVDTQSCGEGAAIIFRPDGIDRYEGEYTVEITGLKTKAGQDTTLEYSVEFFTPTCLDGHSYTTHTEEATCTTPGSISQICSVCGTENMLEEIPALGHQWGSGVCKDNSLHTVTCQRTGCGLTQDLPHETTTAEINGISVVTCSGCNLHISSSVSISIDVPQVMRWAPNEEGYMAPYGDSKQLDLTAHTTLSGTLTWTLSDPNGTGAVLDKNGLLTLTPSCLAGALSVIVSDAAHTETILVELLRDAPYCWGGTVPTSVSKVDVPLPGENSLQIQYNATFYDQYGGILESPTHELSWFIQPQDNWDSEYTEYNGVTIDSNGLLTVPAGAKSCQLNVRCRPSCWNSGSSCGTSLSVYAEPTVWWSAPGYLAWDQVDGAARYVVCLLDENGERIGSQKTTSTHREIFSFIGWYLGNEEQPLRIVVEARDADDRKFLVMDPGITVYPQISQDVLPYACTDLGNDKYSLTVMHPIHGGDVLLDTWDERNCTRSEFSSGRTYYYTTEHTRTGSSQQVRLIYNSHLEDTTNWVFSITRGESKTAQEALSSSPITQSGLSSTSGSPLTAACMTSTSGLGENLRHSTYVMLANTSNQDITVSAIVAQYDSSTGRMISIGTKEISVSANSQAAQMLYTDLNSTSRLSFFLLDGQHHALTVKKDF